ncbi:aminopeptidase P family protein [Facklamia sp. DSM 111018]|uniref:Aminopeptidase P family protein n=1 Tax=Facklamia lactis TaxID=2749967 RepID=A0ABS0LR66_9LACT|nr:Xaa-Pro peptidase family protein [Facklamia lactis]MBG9980975.1 aminopeptidase P family protein [Facklamia lactis]MBG9986662.1 aminopeptidase P family protein [Facklamia lactis]
MQRLDRLRQLLKEEQLEALYVTDLLNVRYLTGFTGSAGAVLVTHDEAYFITDFRYVTQANKEVTSAKVVIHQQGVDQEVQKLIEQDQIRTLGIEANQMNVSQYLKIQKLFDLDIKPTDALIEKLRQVKDQEEIAIIRQACEITDLAFEHILNFVKAGVTELQVANELESFLKNKGASSMSFDTIVASGERSAMPHGVASEKVIENGDMVTIDFGCYYKGYSSDMTRTFAVGSVSDQLREIYEIVLEAHNRVIAGTRAGMTGQEVDALARDYITEKGYGQYFGHSTGHGLGLDVHEMPAVSSRSETVMVENMVITDEPGIYLPGIGGVRIEDDLIIKENGVESINSSPKELIILTEGEA